MPANDRQDLIRRLKFKLRLSTTLTGDERGSWFRHCVTKRNGIQVSVSEVIKQLLTFLTSLSG